MSFSSYVEFGKKNWNRERAKRKKKNEKEKTEARFHPSAAHTYSTALHTHHVSGLWASIICCHWSFHRQTDRQTDRQTEGRATAYVFLHFPNNWIGEQAYVRTSTYYLLVRTCEWRRRRRRRRRREINSSYFSWACLVRTYVHLCAIPILLSAKKR